MKSPQSDNSTPPLSPLKNLLTWWIAIACHKTYWVLVIALFLGAGAFEYTSHHLGFNTNTNDMLAADLPFRQTYQHFEQGFPQYTHNILVVIDADSPEKARDAAKRLAAQLETQPQLFSSVYLPRASAFMESHALLYQDMDELEKNASDLATMQPFLGKLSSDLSLRGLFLLLTDVLEAEDAPDSVDITAVATPVTAAIRAVMNHQHEPLSWQELIQGESSEATKQRQQFILLQPRMDFSSFLAAKPAMQTVKNAAATLQLDADHGVRVRLTGSAALSHDELVSVSAGAGIAALLALLLVGVLLTIGLGSFRFVVATLLCLMTGLILTAAFAALTIGHLNLISVAFAVLYIGLGVDYAIHLCLRCREIEKTGQGTTSAIGQAAHDVGTSLLLCAVTTAVGFYCFVPTDYTGVSELGIISGSGMFISLVVTLTLLPAILCIWNKFIPLQHKPAVRAKEAIAWQFPTMLSLDGHAHTVRIMAIVAALAAAIWLPQARFDYNPINLRDQASESITTYRDLIASHNISPSSIMVLTPDAERVNAIQQRLNRLDTVDKTISLFNFIPSDQNEKLAIIDDMSLLLGFEPETKNPIVVTTAEQVNAIQQLESALNIYITYFSQSKLDDTALQKLNVFRQLYQTLQSFSRNLASQPTDAKKTTLMTLDKDLLGTLPTTLDLLQTTLSATTISRQNIPASLSRRWFSDTDLYRIEVIPKEDIGEIGNLRRFVSQVRMVSPDATGAPIFTLEAGDAVIRAFIQAFGIAFVLIFLLLLALLRSIADTLLILLPLLLAAMLTGACAVLLDIPFNFANVIALPLLLGIGVDNGIHMVQRFRHMQSDQRPRQQSVHHEILRTSTSKAVVLSALTTICSFGALAFSPHQGTADMGQLLTLGVIIILICTLVVLPAFLQWQPAQKPSETGVKS
ncbi:MAG: MMPL family transporter [Mariprofundus sp.]|nr:MMPL family transporter [Mariprofundus sp.]